MNSTRLPPDYLSRFDVLSSFKHTEFSALPTLEAVVSRTFVEVLNEQRPSLGIHPGATLKVAVPLRIAQLPVDPARRFHFMTPAQLMIERFTGLSERTLRQGVHWLSTEDNIEALSLLTVNMRDIEVIASEWSPQIPTLFKQALACFWGQVSGAGHSPLSWLARTLKAGLYSAALNAQRVPALTQEQVSLATEVTLASHKQHRLRSPGEGGNRAYVVNIDTTRLGEPRYFRLPGVAVLERSEDQQTTLLAWSLAGGIEAFDSLQAFGETLASRLEPPLSEHASWSLDEPEDEFFVALAHTLLDKQLEDIDAMFATARVQRWSAERLEHGLLNLTQMPDVFSARERSQFEQVADQFPAWLEEGSADDQLAYSALLAAEITRQSEARGHSFLDDVAPLPDYASHQLRSRILQDHPHATSVNVDDIEVHDLSIENLQMAWMTDDVMSLVDLSLTYIGGKPPGFLSVRGRNGVTLPQWMNAGYVRPHLESVLLEGELALLPRRPATLSERVLEGDHFEFLFDANTGALIALADRQSVSVSERRWSFFKQCAWTLFNGLTFFVSGPLAKAAWLFQVLVSIDTGLQARIERDKAAASQSVLDLLFIISLTLLHRGLTFQSERTQKARLKTAVDEPLFSVPEPIKPRTAPVRLQPRTPGTVPAHGREDYLPLDFSWFGASPQMTANQSVAIATFKVAVDLSKATKIEVGPFKGTYTYQGKYWVKIKDAVYRVSREQDGLVIQDDRNILRLGPWLMTDGQGSWDFDLRLRLRGGGPKKTVQALRAAKEKQISEFNTQRVALIAQKQTIQGVMELTLTLLKTATSRRVELIGRLELEFERWYKKQAELLKLLHQMNTFSRIANYETEKLYGLAAVLKFAFDVQILIEGEYRQLKGSSQSVVFSSVKFQALESLAGGESEPYEKMIADLKVSESWEKRLVRTSELAFDALQEIGNVDAGNDSNLKRITEIADLDPAWRYWNVVYVKTLLELLVKHEVSELTPLELDCINYFDNSRLATVAMSQASIVLDGRISTAERITFFDSALHAYEVARLQCRGLLALQSNAFRNEYVISLDRMLERLSHFAEVIFSNAIKAIENVEVEEPAPSSSQQAARAESRPHSSTRPKKVFKTDKQQVLVGVVRDPVAGETAEVVDVIDSMSNMKVSSYRNTGGESWIEVEKPIPTVPRRANQRRALSRLESQASEQLEQVESTVQLIKSQAKTAKIPLEIEDILVRKSQALADTARSMQDILTGADVAEGHISDVRASAVRGTIAELELNAERLKQEGRQIRIEMIKEQYPTEERVDYLMTQGEIGISRLGPRRSLSKGVRRDYLQEYEIKDKSGAVLWYAHFHYDTQDAAPQSYTAAHLKTLEQRTMSERALYMKARNSTDVIEVYRGKINAALAGKLFINL
ncbi:hypothetical protein ACIPV9_02060 [Pseudomonas psychrophila]|uniref:hypothetical protein n=1 Tax=Pseudomonas psychrophila TaxID=122355 RepID=UPI00380EC2E8